MEHWLEQEIAQWVHPMKDRSDDPSHHERTLLPRNYISLLVNGSTTLVVNGIVYGVMTPIIVGRLFDVVLFGFLVDVIIY